MSPGTIRALCIFLPALLAGILLVATRPGARWAGAALMATLWNLGNLGILHHLAMRFGWWEFHLQGGLYRGLPADLWLGWAIFWGACVTLTARFIGFSVAALIAVVMDVALMPQFAPSITLGPDWLYGELLGVGSCLLPGLLLARCMAADRFLTVRVALLVTGFGILFLWLVPDICLEQSGGSWRPILLQPLWEQCLLATLGFCLLLPAISAVQEFAERGGGTPVPTDPPKRLVRSGIFAYIANPMQASMTAAYLLLGAATKSWVLTAGAPLALAAALGVAGGTERSWLLNRYGCIYQSYQSQVRRWWIRWIPSYPATSILYVSETCHLCQKLGVWLRRHSFVSLEIRPAEERPELTRLTYCAPGYQISGLPALCRACEHIHLGWALVAFILRLPGIRHLAQWAVDLSGGGPRSIPSP